MLKWLRSSFIAGVIVLTPLAVTYLAVSWTFSLIDGLVGVPLQSLFKVRVPGLGALITLALILLAGTLASNYAGRQVLHLMDWVVLRVPVIRKIYHTMKQIVDSLVAGRQTAFQRVVMIEYPRRGLYTIGFVTGETLTAVLGCQPPEGVEEKALLNVFVPTTPNPTSGMLVFLPPGQVTPLSLSVEDGLKLVISGGVVGPAGAAANGTLTPKSDKEA